MKRHSPPAASPTKQRGFTLIEVLIVVIIVGVLAGVAYPSFMDALRKSRRSDAVAALTAVQQAQERWRTNQPTYAGNSLLTAAPSASPPGLGQSATSSKSYYDIAVASASATGYTITATASPSRSQAQDANCQVLAVRVEGGSVAYGSGSSAAAFPDANRCWAR